MTNPVTNAQALKAAKTLLAYYKAVGDRAGLNELFDMMAVRLAQEIERIPDREPLRRS